MTRQERAKQFMPFDAMKGLSEALREREKKHLQNERKSLSDEESEKLSRKLERLEAGMKIHIWYYSDFRDCERTGWVEETDPVFRYLVLDGVRIYFDDLYRVRILDAKRN